MEALIEEARRRARRRRRIYAAITLAALGAAAWASFDIGGDHGVSLGRSAAGGRSGSASTASRAGRWLPTGGPDGGFVISLAVDPADPRVVYAGGFDNIFKSTDGGGTWHYVGHAGAEVSALAIDPTHPETVYAGTTGDLLKSTDGGRHWHTADAGMGNAGTSPRWGREHWLGALLVEPNRPQTVYARVDFGLFMTRNGGARWRFERPRLGPRSVLSAAAIDPAHPGTVYAAWTVSGYGGAANLYKTTDGGSSWQRITTHGAKPSFASMAIDADASGTIYATDATHPGIYTSTDGGTTWSVVTLPLQSAGGLQVFPGSRGRLYATTTSGSVFASSDAGATWQALGTEPGLAGGPIAVDPRNPETVYGSGDGVEKSIDGGHSWTTLHRGLVNTLISSLVLAPGSPTTLYAGADGRVFTSSDRGKSWRVEGSGLAGATVTTLAVDPQHPQTIYAGNEWHDPGSPRSSGLFKSVDGGLTWSTVQTGFPENEVQALAINPQHPSTIYVGACGGGCYGRGFFLKTVDGGATWQPVTFPRSRPVQSLAIDPHAGDTVFAGTAKGGLFRSRDGGSSWQRVALGHGVPSYTSHVSSPFAFVAIAIDPSDTRTVYAGTRTGGILKSTDGGTTWTAANTGLTSRSISALTIDPHDPQLLFASTGDGVYESTDAAENWQPSDRSLRSVDVPAFVTDPDGRVYAATGGDGVLQLKPGR